MREKGETGEKDKKSKKRFIELLELIALSFYLIFCKYPVCGRPSRLQGFSLYDA